MRDVVSKKPEKQSSRMRRKQTLGVLMMCCHNDDVPQRHAKPDMNLDLYLSNPSSPKTISASSCLLTTRQSGSRGLHHRLPQKIHNSITCGWSLHGIQIPCSLGRPGPRTAAIGQIRYPTTRGKLDKLTTGAAFTCDMCRAPTSVMTCAPMTSPSRSPPSKQTPHFPCLSPPPP